MRIGPPGRVRLSLVRQSPLIHGRFSFQDGVNPESATAARIPRLPLQLLQHLPVVPLLLAGLLLCRHQHGPVMLLKAALAPADVQTATPRLGLGMAVGAPLFLKRVLRLLTLIRQSP